MCVAQQPNCTNVDKPKAPKVLPQLAPGYWVPGGYQTQELDSQDRAISFEPMAEFDSQVEPKPPNKMIDPARWAKFGGAVPPV